MNPQEKKDAVLSAANVLFARLEEAGDSLVVPDAPKALAAEVNLQLPEIAVVLRSLHRGRKIGLLEGVLVGNTITIAPNQSLLQMPHAIARGRSGRLSKARPGQTSPKPAVTEPEEIELSVEEGLRKQVATLEGVVTSLQAALEKEQGQARRAREETETRISGLLEKLAEARRAIHDLTLKVGELQPEANKVSELLAKVAELQGTPVPHDLTLAISRITSTYATEEG